MSLLLLAGLAWAADDVECDDTMRSEALEGFTTAITSGDQDGALNALVLTLEDEAFAPCHGLAYASMGGLLESREMPYAALLAHGEAIKLNAQGASEAVPRALDLADLVNDPAYLEEVFAANVGLDVDDATRSHLAYLAARGHYAQGNLSTALGILALVDKSGEDAGRAMALKGVILSQQARWTDAMAALLQAEQLMLDDPEMLDVIYLNIGRVYYAAGNYPRSAQYLAQVRRESHWWPEAQFERAWAHFRMDDMNGALSLLHNHVSPYYEEWYFPEAELLRTYSLFLLCKFPEASAQIDSFQTKWTPVRDEVQTTVASMNEQDVFEDARDFVEGKESRLGALVLRDMPHDQRFLDSVAAVDGAQAELDRLQGNNSDWARFFFSKVQARQRDLVMGEGGRVKTKVEKQVDTLTTMLNDTEITKLDMLRLETRLYQNAANIGKMPEIDSRAYRRERVRKGYVVWPFEGEYWADEVGYYRVDAHAECPEGLMSGQ